MGYNYRGNSEELQLILLDEIRTKYNLLPLAETVIKNVDTRFYAFNIDGFIVRTCLTLLRRGSFPNPMSGIYFKYNLEIIFKQKGCELLDAIKIKNKRTIRVKYIATCGHIHECDKADFFKRKYFMCNDCVAKLHDGAYNNKIAERNKAKWEKQLATVYLIRLYNENETFYKIGITERPLNKRFWKSKVKYNYEEILTVEVNKYDACFLEKELHLLNDKYCYTPKIYFGGHTECFSDVTTDVYKRLKGVEKHGYSTISI